MSNFVDITKKDAISKFGSHFFVGSFINDSKLSVIENLNSNIKNEFSFDNREDAFIKLKRLFKLGHTYSVKHFQDIEKRLPTKFTLFLYKNGLIRDEIKKKVIESYLNIYKNAKENLEESSNQLSLLNSINIDDCTVNLPEKMKILSLTMDKDKEYYIYYHDDNIKNRILDVVKVNEHYVDVDHETSIIDICYQFSNSNNNISGFIKNEHLNNYNGLYIKLNYKVFVFFEKKDAVSFILSHAKNDVDSLKKMLTILE